MKKVRNNTIFKRVFLLIVSFVLVASIVSITYAAYTYSQHAQRGIAPYETGEMFSSNQLRKGSASNNIINVHIPSLVGADPTTIITVCNYPQGKQTLINNVNIEYSISIAFIKFDGENYTSCNGKAKFREATNSEIEDESKIKYEASNGVATRYTTGNHGTLYVMDASGANEFAVFTASITGPNNTSASISGTTVSASIPANTNDANATFPFLTKDVASADVYTLSLSKSFAEDENMYVLVTATPKGEDSAASLSGLFNATLRIESAENLWTGSFFESGETLPSKYDGYNYIITGFGQGTCTITWDKTQVEISYVSIQEIMSINGASYVEGESINTLTFAVDSNQKSRYELQFYKIKINTDTWDYMSSNVVRLGFIAAEEQ